MSSERFEPMADPERIAQLIAHRVCCGVEHDPSNGKLHGYCVVCSVPWPCEYAGKPPHTDAELQAAVARAKTGVAEGLRAAAKLADEFDHLDYEKETSIGAEILALIPAEIAAEQDRREKLVGELVESLREAMPTVEFYYKREVESPSNHQEFARESREQIVRLRKALAELAALRAPAGKTEGTVSEPKALTADYIARLAGWHKPWHVVYTSRGDATYARAIVTADGKTVCDFAGCSAATNTHTIKIAEEIVAAVNGRAAELELAKLEAAREEAKWWLDYHIINSDYPPADMDPGPQRIADLARQIEAKRQAMRAIADGGKA